MKKKLFLCAALHHVPDGTTCMIHFEDKGTDILIPIIASDAEQAKLQLVVRLSDEFQSRLEEVELLVRPF